MAKRILSISYDASLLCTRQLLFEERGYEVVSGHGLTEALRACESEKGQFDLIVLGHTIPPEHKEKIILQMAEKCPAPILALLKGYQSPVKGATRSVDADPNVFLPVVQELLEETA